MSGRGRAIGAVVTAMCAGLIGLSATAVAKDGGRPFHIVLSGANEVMPNNPHGNADRGSITLRVNPGQERICYSLGPITLAAGDALPSAGHIHVGPAGVAGPIVVHLFGASAAPTSYPTGTTCVHAERALIKQIMHDPSEYYVNLHNAQHPAGVMRGQLAG